MGLHGLTSLLGGVAAGPRAVPRCVCAAAYTTLLAVRRCACKEARDLTCPTHPPGHCDEGAVLVPKVHAVSKLRLDVLGQRARETLHLRGAGGGGRGNRSAAASCIACILVHCHSGHDVKPATSCGAAPWARCVWLRAPANPCTRDHAHTTHTPARDCPARLPRAHTSRCTPEQDARPQPKPPSVPACPCPCACRAAWPPRPPPAARLPHRLPAELGRGQQAACHLLLVLALLDVPGGGGSQRQAGRWAGGQAGREQRGLGWGAV